MRPMYWEFETLYHCCLFKGDTYYLLTFHKISLFPNSIKDSLSYYNTTRHPFLFCCIAQIYILNINHTSNRKILSYIFFQQIVAIYFMYLYENKKNRGTY